MDPERWRRAFEVFKATIARDAGERATFVADACLGDEAIRTAVEQLVRAQVVALKTLLRANPADIYHLKREFRGLADIAHRNLVSLYELVVEDARCFFTMELVKGVNLVQVVRGPSPATAPLPVERLRSVFQQLAEGVAELHRHGKPEDGIW